MLTGIAELERLIGFYMRQYALSRRQAIDAIKADLATKASLKTR